MKLMIIAGARPNFVKISPIIRELESRHEHKSGLLKTQLVHTGQHYDHAMSGSMFEQLKIRAPDIFLEISGRSHAKQTADILSKLEDVMLDSKPDIILVVGDVNSTLAASLCASKLGITIAHIEAGLRSHDRRMPEEINRIVTDSISDLLFTTEQSANVNLQKEGISREKVHFVGNVMIDSLILNLDLIKNNLPDIPDLFIDENYVVTTFHRPSNVDTPEKLEIIISSLHELVTKYQVVFPVHPRTMKNLLKFDLLSALESVDNIFITPPLGYIEFLSLVKTSALVISDSGGIQEECVLLNTPCITIRENTERPITIECGTNRLCALKTVDISDNVETAIKSSRTFIPPLWDGKTSSRIVDILFKEHFH